MLYYTGALGMHAAVYSLQYSTFDYNDPCKNNALCESNDPLALLKTNIMPVVILQRLRYSGKFWVFSRSDTVSFATLALVIPRNGRTRGPDTKGRPGCLDGVTVSLVESYKEKHMGCWLQQT